MRDHKQKWLGTTGPNKCVLLYTNKILLPLFPEVITYKRYRLKHRFCNTLYQCLQPPVSHMTCSILTEAMPQEPPYTWLPHCFLISGLLSVQLCPASVCLTLCLHAHCRHNCRCSVYFLQKSKSALLMMCFNPYSSSFPHTYSPDRALWQFTQMKGLERNRQCVSVQQMDGESMRVK